MPTNATPSDRTRLAAAIGSTVASVTSRSADTSRGSGAIADGTNSRSATSSHSAESPSNGRLTTTSTGPPAAPWQALERRPDPHGQGCRELSPSRCFGPALTAVRLATCFSLVSGVLRRLARQQRTGVGRGVRG